MRKAFRVLYLASCFLILSFQALHSQTAERAQEVRKNTVRVNITNLAFFGIKSYLFGYERTIGDHQSFSINAGRLILPGLSLIDANQSNSLVQLQKNSKESGYNFSLDYRFYLKKENKYVSPRGVYIGPYISHSGFNRENTWTLNTSSFQGDVITDFNLKIFTVGGELGYQFILWKRFAIDLILIGPGISSYSLKAQINTTLSPDDEAELFQRINDALADHFPGYSLVLDDAEFEKKGTINTTSFGFRYMINLGFRF